jgi:hypothetical protein
MNRFYFINEFYGAFKTKRRGAKPFGMAPRRFRPVFAGSMENYLQQPNA